ncbi:MAG: hypothetical protein MI924_11875, partial [Chloroflexales bacterium]|nr:hypothetical protein [Chloroflexales bacterium]
ASDLLYLRARWYDPGSGTLTTRDPFAGRAETPYSLHPYQYAYSNPIHYSDATGKFACIIALNNSLAGVGGSDEPLYVNFCAGSISKADVYVDAEGEIDALGTLIRLFVDSDLPGGTTPTAMQLRRSHLSPAAERLEFILHYTQDWKGVPFRKIFNDSGFNPQFQDPWPEESGNQVGHFLTAVGLAYAPDHYINFLTRLGLFAGLIVPTSSEDAALRLIVGHEKVSDEISNELATIHAQYRAATDIDVTKFLQALAYDAEGRYGDRDTLLCAIVQLPEAASKDNRKIIHDSGRVGNSIEDLRLSLKGYAFGLRIKDGRIASLQQAGSWLDGNLR